MAEKYATSVERVDNSSGETEINGGEPLWIHYIHVAATAATTQNLFWYTNDIDFVTVPICVLARDPFIFDAQAHCHKLVIAAPASSTTVLVAYRKDG